MREATAWRPRVRAAPWCGGTASARAGGMGREACWAVDARMRCWCWWRCVCVGGGGGIGAVGYRGKGQHPEACAALQSVACSDVAPGSRLPPPPRSSRALLSPRWALTLLPHHSAAPGGDKNTVWNFSGSPTGTMPTLAVGHCAPITCQVRLPCEACQCPAGGAAFRPCRHVLMPGGCPATQCVAAGPQGEPRPSVALLTARHAWKLWLGVVGLCWATLGHAVCAQSSGSPSADRPCRPGSQTPMAGWPPAARTAGFSSTTWTTGCPSGRTCPSSASPAPSEPPTVRGAPQADTVRGAGTCPPTANCHALAACRL